MPFRTVSYLSEETGKDRRTVKKRLFKLPCDKRGRFDSIVALEAIYCGQFTNGNGEFISTPEAIRQLTIAKKDEIDVELEIKRGNWLPKSEVAAAYNELFQSIVGILKAHRRQLGEDKLEEILEELRDITKE